MNYVAFLATVMPLNFLILVSALYLVRRRTYGDEAGSLLTLSAKVLVLTVIVNLISIVPIIGLAGVIFWIIALKRLSGLDVLSTVLFSFTLGFLCFAISLMLARYFQVPLVQQSLGG